MYIHKIDIVSDAVAEPVSVTEAKQWLQISFDTQDAVIGGHIAAARDMLERFTGCSLALKEYELICNTEKYIALPYGPVDEITSVVRLGQWDEDDTILVLGEDYQVRGDRIEVQFAGDYKVVYKAGYVPLPSDIREDIIRIVGWMNKTRGVNYENSDLTQYPEWSTLASVRYQKVVV